MTIDDKIRDEKLKNDINREAAKVSALSSKKLININILQVKKCFLLINDKWQNKLSLDTLDFFKKQIKNDWRAKRKTNKNNRKSRGKNEWSHLKTEPKKYFLDLD